MPTAHANNVEFYYELHGEGEPLVLISGYTGDHTQWGHFIDPLSKKFKVLTFDNQGVGQTKDDNSPLSADVMADNIVALADQLDLPRFHVAGQSMGGSIAQMIAIRHPGRVSKIILSCTSPHWGIVMLKALESILILVENNVPFEIAFDAMAPWCYGSEYINDSEKMKLRKKEVLETPFPPSLADIHRQYDVLESFDSTSDLGNIKAPTLIISASEDILATRSETKLLKEKIPGAIHKELSGGHSIPIEQPDEWLETAMSFLST